MPTVGSSMMSTSTPAVSHLARLTFCWLPPLRLATTVLMDGALMSSRSIMGAAAAFSARLGTQPRKRARRCQTVMVMFLRMEWMGMSPSSLRSSDT